MQVILVGPHHHRTGEPQAEHLYETESTWAEVDNCWGNLGYLGVAVYQAPEAGDMAYKVPPVDTTPLTAHSAALQVFRRERNADMRVRPSVIADMAAVALRNARLS